jgi:hypothetical protein
MNASCLGVVLVVLGILAAISTQSYGAVPQSISYQGCLTDALGNPIEVDSTYNITFSVYDDPVTGAQLWTSGLQPVPVVGGCFIYYLGSNVAFGDDLFTDSLRFLSIWIDVEHLDRRRAIGDVPKGKACISSIHLPLTTI